MAQEFDLVVIGGGPAGYVAAIKASQLGMKTACVEKRETLGGTCLNVGCIPSKALLHSSHMYEEANKHFKENGIEFSGLKLNLKQMMKRKSDIVDSLTKGISGLFAKNKVTYINGHGQFNGNKELVVGKEIIKAKNYIIATGSEVAPLPSVEIDEERIVSSTGALELSSVPKKMTVIGGGVIGLEMGSVWSRLGAEVTVVEYLDKILPTMDADVSKEFYKILEKQGMKFKMSTKVMGAKVAGNSVTLDVEPAAGGKKETIKSEVVLVAIGRKPYTEGLGLENIGVAVNEKGQIPIDAKFKTSADGVYAVGDVVQGAMLAHKAEEEAIAAVEIIAGQNPHINYDAIPGIVYTFPEVAGVGKTEDELKASGIEYNVGKFPLLANSRARANGNTDGFVKILADKKTDEILGGHIISPNAGELIQEIVMGIEYKASSEDIARICHGHPGLNEAVKEAALATHFKPIHM